MDFIFDPSLVLYLPLEQLDGSSFTSKDAYGHLCTVTGALWRPNGHYFDKSDDQIDCGNPVATQLTSALTLDIWCKPSNVTAVQAIVSKDNGAQRNYWISIEPSLLFTMVVSNVKKELSMGVSPVIDTWYNFVGTSDGINMRAYVNGEYKTTRAGGVCDNDAVNLIIGSRISDRYFGGVIGEVRIYNRALTFPEIQHNYLATKWRYR